MVAVVIPIYLLIWLAAVLLSGGYDKPYKFVKALRGSAIGTLFILILYGLLPESFRFSRALIVLGALWYAAVLLLTRLSGYLLHFDGFVLGRDEKKRFLIIGSAPEANRVEAILKSTALKTDFIGIISTDQFSNGKCSCLGTLDQVSDIITIYQINEVIFCSKDVSHQTIMDKMAAWQSSRISYKIAPEDSLSIIGSNSINTKGDLYTVAIQGIDTVGNRRNKRFFDLLSSIVICIFFPFILLLPGGGNILLKAFKVFTGKLSWVGYCQPLSRQMRLPSIKNGVLCPGDVFDKTITDSELLNRINLLYARDYTVFKDLNIFFRAIKKAGRKD